MLNAKGLMGFFIVFVSFFLFELLTLSHYGTDFDTINHLPRGQAYLRYFLSGKLNYKGLPEYVEYHQKDNTLLFSPDKPQNTIPHRSIYQLDGYNGTYFLNKDGGHPPLTDIFASIFNYLFFQKLRFLNDIDSYHVYIILTASVLAATIFWWTKKRFGTFAGIIGVTALITYPLFLGESHFNLKDVPEATFYSLTLILFYEGVINRKLIYIIFSAIFFGFAWGTKFNILFSPVIFLSWLGLYYCSSNKTIRDGKFLLIVALVLPLIATTIFFGSWPFLWIDPFSRFMQIVSYYKTIGINPSFDRAFIFLGFNTYALQWILFTTPLVTLFLSTLGIVFAFLRGFKEKEKTALLVLFWLVVPIARVTMPNAGIYGGVRQIMEFVPAMAILAGIGARYIVTLLQGSIVLYKKQLNNKTIQQLSPKTTLLALQVLSILMFVPITLKLISIHPNENVYFNPLIGGLRGAKERNLPYWGNSFGNAYRQAAVWVNQNAEPESTLVLAQELMPNLPKLFVRSDLKYGNNLRSGYVRKGEYVIGLDYGNAANRSYYSSRYYNHYLQPLYQIKVDEASILNIWKNDLSRTKKGFTTEEIAHNASYKQTDRGILIDLKKPLYISKIKWSFSQINCKQANQIYFNISIRGNSWYKTPHVLPEDLPIPTLERQPAGNTITYPFAAEYARYIHVIVDPENSCPNKIQSLNVYHLPHAQQP